MGAYTLNMALVFSLGKLLEQVETGITAMPTLSFFHAIPSFGCPLVLAFYPTDRLRVLLLSERHNTTKRLLLDNHGS